MRVYFDNAATTPISEVVIDAMIPCIRDLHGNPSSIHADGRKVRTAIENARKTVAKHLNASIGEIFFTSGGTESNNMALKCAVRDLGVKYIISSPTEHHCILHTLESIDHCNADVEVKLLDVDEKGCINLTQLEELLQNTTEKTLVSIMHGNNEIGSMIDLDRVSNICQKHDAYFHSDTVQTIGKYPIDLSKTKINFLSGASHKFHGPKGVGFIYINNGNMLKPMIDGGAQERNMRGGTENVYGIVGLATALENAIENMESWHTYVVGIRDYMKAQLLANFEGIRFNGDHDGDCLYNILSVSFPPSKKSEMLLLNMDIHGISVSGGSACSSGAEKGSHVIACLNPEAGRKTARFSFSHKNTKEEVDFVIGKLKTIIPSIEMNTASSA